MLCLDSGPWKTSYYFSVSSNIILKILLSYKSDKMNMPSNIWRVTRQCYLILIVSIQQRFNHTTMKTCSVFGYQTRCIYNIWVKILRHILLSDRLHLLISTSMHIPSKLAASEQLLYSKCEVLSEFVLRAFISAYIISLLALFLYMVEKLCGQTCVLLVIPYR